MNILNQNHSNQIVELKEAIAKAKIFDRMKDAMMGSNFIQPK